MFITFLCLFVAEVCTSVTLISLYNCMSHMEWSISNFATLLFYFYYRTKIYSTNTKKTVCKQYVKIVANCVIPIFHYIAKVKKILFPKHSQHELQLIYNVFTRFFFVQILMTHYQNYLCFYTDKMCLLCLYIWILIKLFDVLVW